MTAESDLRSQLHDKTRQDVSLCALYRTFDTKSPIPPKTLGVAFVSLVGAAFVSFAGRATTQNPHKVAVGLSLDQVFVFAAVCRFRGRGSARR
ncbi:MAG: hypothetical protein ACRDZ8_03170 [Acidimicrobiales bacterium]